MTTIQKGSSDDDDSVDGEVLKLIPIVTAGFALLRTML
jgi:hypothetical protein